MNWFRFAVLCCWSCVLSTAAQAQWQMQNVATKASLRGLYAVNAKVVWASGTRGTFLRTTDGGTTWQVGTVPGAENLDFRDVEAFDADNAFLLSIGNGESSRIYQTADGGRTWTLRFQNTNKDAFFDAMAFWDRQHGLAVSDSVNGRFLIIATADGGKTWQAVPGDKLPPALPGEGAFAASGTCLITQGKQNAWLVTGVKTARVFRSTDRGRSWEVVAAPLRSEAESSGIFSVAFRDAQNGVIVGGDYRQPKVAEQNAALTRDGGRTWMLTKQMPTGFRSGVVWVRAQRGWALVAVGTSGSDVSLDEGATWQPLDQDNYNSVSFAHGSGWAVGPEGRVAKFVGKLE
jgi:photosystem II stability/assembly factor-like uncharacterized protein